MKVARLWYPRRGAGEFMTLRTVRWLLVVVFASAAMASCAARRSPERASTTDPKLAPSTYMEDGRLVALVVSTRAAEVRRSKTHFPLEIAVVNKGLAGLSISPESFVLVDDSGRRHPVAGREDLANRYGNTDIDRRFSEAAGPVRAKFSQYLPVPSNMTPGFDRGVARDHVSLPRFAYLLDFVYFPRPEGGAAGRTYELFLSAPELPDPVFVRFRIEGSHGPP